MFQFVCNFVSIWVHNFNLCQLVSISVNLCVTLCDNFVSLCKLLSLCVNLCKF